MTMIDRAWRWVVGVGLSGAFACASEPDADVEPVPELVCEDARWSLTPEQPAYFVGMVADDDGTIVVAFADEATRDAVLMRVAADGTTIAEAVVPAPRPYSEPLRLVATSEGLALEFGGHTEGSDVDEDGEWDEAEGGWLSTIVALDDAFATTWDITFDRGVVVTSITPSADGILRVAIDVQESPEPWPEFPAGIYEVQGGEIVAQRQFADIERVLGRFASGALLVATDDGIGRFTDGPDVDWEIETGFDVVATPAGEAAFLVASQIWRVDGEVLDEEYVEVFAVDEEGTIGWTDRVDVTGLDWPALAGDGVDRFVLAGSVIDESGASGAMWVGEYGADGPRTPPRQLACEIDGADALTIATDGTLVFGIGAWITALR